MNAKDQTTLYNLRNKAMKYEQELKSLAVYFEVKADLEANEAAKLEYLTMSGYLKIIVKGEI